MSYTYRKAKNQDVENLKALGLLAYSQYSEVIGEVFAAKMRKAHTNEIYSDFLTKGTGFVCEFENRLVGMAFLLPHGNPHKFFDADWAHIRYVGVHPDHERKGIGKALTRLCIEQAKDSGEKTLALHSSIFQPAAVHIYERLGFQKIKELDGDFGQTTWLFILPLEKSSEEITYQMATRADIPQLIKRRVEFLLGFFPETPRESVPNLETHLQAFFEAELDSPLFRCVVAKSGGEIVGTGCLAVRKQPGHFIDQCGSVGFILFMYTVPRYRRKGICSQIVHELVELGRQSGITAFELRASADGEKVYQKIGFHIHNEPTYRRYLPVQDLV